MLGPSVSKLSQTAGLLRLLVASHTTFLADGVAAVGFSTGMHGLPAGCSNAPAVHLPKWACILLKPNTDSHYKLNERKPFKQCVRICGAVTLSYRGFAAPFLSM